MVLFARHWVSTDVVDDVVCEPFPVGSKYSVVKMRPRSRTVGVTDCLNVYKSTLPEVSGTGPSTGKAWNSVS